MKLLFACIMLFGLLSSNAFARTETKCWFNNCLRDGWRTSEWGTFYRAETSCINQDCLRQGWTTVANNNMRSEIRCKNGGCFQDGWMETRVYPNGSYQNFDIQCWGPSCMSGGWVVRAHNGPAVAEVRCINGNCWNWGWDSVSYGGPRTRTTCGLNDCFRHGWTTDPW